MSSTNPVAKKARVATAVAGSSGPHPAAPPNRVDEVGSSSSSVAQSAAAKEVPSCTGRVLNAESGAGLKSEESRKSLLLQLKRPHYDAIKDRRKLWEARPLFDGSFRQTIYDKLAVVGNTAILQSGAGTNDRVRIAEVRRYFPQGLEYPLNVMLQELGADLLPDVADARARATIYECLYGFQRCASGFVAMRLEWPSNAEAGVNKEQNDGDPHPTVQSSGDPHPIARVATNNQASHGNTPYQTFDARSRVRWGARECAHREGCGRVFCKTCYSWNR